MTDSASGSEHPSGGGAAPEGSDLDQGHSVTRLLARMSDGDKTAAEDLANRLYADLRHIAATLVRKESVGHTLQATAVVSEAWIRLTTGSTPDWNDWAHFLRTAARVMRRVLVDHARGKGRKRRSATREDIPLDTLVGRYERSSRGLVELDSALARLGARTPLAEQLIELRFFAGLNMSEAATALGIPLRSAEREWQAARAWLRKELQ